MFSKGVEFTFEFDPSDDEVRRTIRDSRCMLKCDACGDAAVVAAARALAAAYDAALAAEGGAGAAGGRGAETCVGGSAPGAGGWIGAAARTVDRVPADDAARAAAAAFLAALPARGDAGADLQLLCHAYLHRRDSAHLGDVFARHGLTPRPLTDIRLRARGLLEVDGRPLEVDPATG